LTVFEHFFMGGSLALAAGLHRRYGWQIVGLSAVAATLPDWDGLTILFGEQPYAEHHRVWGHSLLTAGAAGGVAGILAYRPNLFGRLQAWAAVRFPKEVSPPPIQSPRSFGVMAVWTIVGVLAAYSHLLADYFYPGYAYLQKWPIQLLWPFSDRGWSLAVVPGGRVGTILIFLAGALVTWRWPRRAQLIACGTLLCLVGYVAWWWMARDASEATRPSSAPRIIESTGSSFRRTAGVDVRLENDLSRHLITAGLASLVRQASGQQMALGLHRAETLVPECRRTTDRLAEPAAEGATFDRLDAFASTEMDRQTHNQSDDRLFVHQLSKEGGVRLRTAALIGCEG
jgi:membrane-bound metal-dependent hydrolase YbcI (DUF457 family)